MSTSPEPRRALSALPQRAKKSSASSIQLLTVPLDGITASDYLASVRDPEPPALGRDLRAVAVEANPVGQRIDLELVWNRLPPSPQAAVAAAGFPLTPQVVAVTDRRSATDQQEETDMQNSHIQTALIQARVDDLHRAAERTSSQRSVGFAGPPARMCVGALRELIARWITGARLLRTHP